MNALVSVVIPTYNYGQFVGEAIESVLSQTYRPLELIVVDDGSTDDTQEVLARFEGRIHSLSQENQGLSAARNAGIRLAKGEYLAFLDADDYWMPDKLARQVPVLECSPDVGVIYCGMQMLWTETGATRVQGCLPRWQGDIRRLLLEDNRVTGGPSAVLVRRECFDRVGLFDESIRSIQDRDMWIRISRHYHFAYVDEPLILYRLHGDNMSRGIGMTRKVALRHEYRMTVVRRAFEEDPIDGDNVILRRRALARAHACAGREYCWAGDYRAAVRHLFQAVCLWPFNYRFNRLLVNAALHRVAPLQRQR
jgi:glycosyltransferase involved in cell wall biosynthesis